jgi:hypothetical protein
MPKVIILTEEEKNSLVGHKFDGVQYFNPVLDGLGRWIISEQEVQFCNIQEFFWIKTKELVDFVYPDPPELI